MNVRSQNFRRETGLSGKAHTLFKETHADTRLSYPAPYADNIDVFIYVNINAQIRALNIPKHAFLLFRMIVMSL
jgi:hypothetical protein